MPDSTGPPSENEYEYSNVTGPLVEAGGTSVVIMRFRSLTIACRGRGFWADLHITLRSYVPPLSDRADLDCGQFRVDQEAERIRYLALFHLPDQNRLPELG